MDIESTEEALDVIEREDTDTSIVCVVSDGWCSLERAHHDHTERMDEMRDVHGRFRALWLSGRLGSGYVSIEGTPQEMLALAEAIAAREDEEFKRCAVAWRSDGVILWSPRNSNEKRILITPAQADALSADIRRKLGGETA